MLLETGQESESELEAIGVVIQSGKLSREEVGFGTRTFEPTPRLEGTQMGEGQLFAPIREGACCRGHDPAICEIRTEDNCIAAGGIFKGSGTTCDPFPCCTCCPQYAHFDINGSITISGSYEFIPGWTRTFGNGIALPFVGSLGPGPGSGQYSGGFNTDCECSGEPPCDSCNNETEPDPDCPNLYGPDCVYDRCVPSEPDVPFRCCSDLACEIRLLCVTDEEVYEGAGWYLTVFTGSSDVCGGSFSWSTDSSAVNLPPGYIKLTDDCNLIPAGSWPIDLDPPPGYSFGPAHIDLNIEEPHGACCQSYGDCEEVGESDCDGNFFCAGTTCDNPETWWTDAETGACCYLGDCFDGFSRFDCEITTGAVWMGACTDCATEVCV